MLFRSSAERQEAPLLGKNGFVFYESELPDDVMLEVFRRLSVPDIAQASQVCRSWYSLSEEPQLWKAARLSIHGDYPENQATRENAKLHWLRVHVNTLSEPGKIAYLVTKYQLNNGHPFAKYKKLDTLDILLNTDENIDERAAKGDKRALEIKIDGLSGSSKHPQFNVTDLIDRLAEQGDESAIGWKLEGLANGWYGYQKDPKAVDELINHLAEKGLEPALYRKIESLTTKKHEACMQAANDFIKHLVEQGHEGAIKYKNSRDPKRLARKYASKGIQCVFKDGVRIDFDGAIHFIDNLVKQGHEGAIQWQREIWDGYNKSRQAAVDLIERLVKQGKEEAIKLKIMGLIYGYYGYTRDKKAAIAFNECLIEQGNEAAIERKIESGDMEADLYEYDEEDVYNMNEQQVKQGNLAAIKRKIRSLADDGVGDVTVYGYEYNLEAAFELNEHLVKQGNQWAIKRKIAGLYNGEYGYDKDRIAAIALQDRLIEQGNESVIKQKIRSLTDYNVPYKLVYKQYKLDYDRGGNLFFLLKSWLEEEEYKGKRWAYYLKAQGLKYGILRFGKDRETAIQYILKYGIPY